jgi:hypothetical protein
MVVVGVGVRDMIIFNHPPSIPHVCERTVRILAESSTKATKTYPDSYKVYLMP